MIQWLGDWVKAIYGGTKMWIKGERLESDEDIAGIQSGAKEDDGFYLPGFFVSLIQSILIILLFPWSVLFLFIFLDPLNFKLLFLRLFYYLVNVVVVVLLISIPLAIYVLTL